jgi:dTDP-4-dehydrorhamnose reductase
VRRRTPKNIFHKRRRRKKHSHNIQTNGSHTVFISTDYVFDGSKKEPYTEDDAPNPINTYGISKLAGELYTKQNPKHYIIRVATLFGVAGASGKGGNFIETMITKAQKNESVAVVDDMWMSPTYTKDAALTIKKNSRIKTTVWNIPCNKPKLLHLVRIHQRNIQTHSLKSSFDTNKNSPDANES